MGRSAAVTGEVRQLVAKKRFDILLLQESYVKKQGESHTFYGNGDESCCSALETPMGDDSDQQLPATDDVCLAA